MLKPDEIQALRQRNDQTGEIHVSAGPKFLAEMIARGEAEAVGLEQELREAVWHRIYGDVAQRIARLRRTFVLPNVVLDSAYDEIERAFLEVEDLVKNPFSTPDALDGAPSTGHYDRGTSGGSSA
jgi:hypothetical protein